MAVALLQSGLLARAEYRVQPGDVIEIFVTGVPELQRRVQVKVDGNITLPLVGTVAMAGLSPAALQAKVQAALAGKVLQQRMADGREITVRISLDDVTAAIAEYRPIYVNGDVSRPGEYAYRPALTVRQAVALSGGYDVMRVRLNNPFFEMADLKSDYAALWTELAKEQAHVWRLRQELNDKENMAQNSLLDVPIARATVSQIIKVVIAQFEARQADYERQRIFLQRAIRQGEEEIRTLTEQQQKEEEGERADAEELQKVLELYGKGALPSPRVTDARRAVLLSATRKLQTVAQLMQLKRQQDELLRQIEKLEDQRRIELLRELQEAMVKLTALRAKVQGVTEKLQLVTRSQRVRGGNEFEPEIKIVRTGENGPIRFPADEETQLMPGDVVEVALRLDHAVAKHPTGEEFAPAVGAQEMAIGTIDPPLRGAPSPDAATQSGPGAQP